MKILLVEDNESNRKAMVRILESDGNFVQWVDSGEVAISLVAEHGTDYNVILMDIRLPGMDGIETTANLRQSGFQGPIIILTADDLDSCKQKADEAGCSDIRNKPIKSKELRAIIRHYFK